MREEKVTLVPNEIYRLEQEYPYQKLFEKYNKVFLVGKIEEEFTYSHEIYGIQFLKSTVISKRTSGQKDLIPIIITKSLLERSNFKSGDWVELTGTFRSYNELGKNGKKHLKLFLFPSSMLVYSYPNVELYGIDQNLIYLDGYICKPPTYRETPLGRFISDFTIAVNRDNGKSDYIPSIAWGKDALEVSTFEVGTRIKSVGRIQSREYTKVLENSINSKEETKIAIEISIAKIEN